MALRIQEFISFFGPLQTFSNLEDARNPGPSADTTYPVAVAIARGGVSNTRWLASMGMLLLLAQQYYNHAQLRRETTK